MKASTTRATIFAIVSLATLSGCSAASTDLDTANAPGQQSHSVSSRALWSSGAYNVTTSADTASRSSGTLFTPFRNDDNSIMTGWDGSELRGTCGITFITKRYGITAAHCVRAPHIFVAPWQPLKVQMYRPTGDILSNLSKVTSLTDFFPAFQHGTLSADDGYITDTYDNCFVVTRCGDEFGPQINCSMDADIALIRCDDPVAVGNYTTMPVASTQNLDWPVSVNWAHEIYDVPQEFDARNTPQDDILFDHYTAYVEGDYANNYHYYPNNQLIALGAQPFWNPGGDPNHRNVGVDGNNRLTDLWGCHGTSGSGIYQLPPNSGPQLLGPNSIGANWGDTLCMNAPWPLNQAGLGYTQLQFTQSVSNTAFWDSREW